MFDLENLKTVLVRPQLLLPHKPIFLLSHMRANTSVLGHILGSNPAIAGYYEMHIGYYSWRSFLRQRLIYYKSHHYKPGTRYIFDKILHNYHHVEPDLFNYTKARVIIALREPEQTIKSIVNLFRTYHETHEYQSVDKAEKYYIERLKNLVDIAPRFNSYYFLKAEELKTRTGENLKALGDWLELKTPLQTEYQQFPLTGQQSSGDRTPKLRSGKLESVSADYRAIQLTDQQIERSQAIYRQALSRLQAGSINREDQTSL